jgi:mono/diheme cytochrome c family protein
MADANLPPDPIRTQSLSGPIAVSTALLILTTGWAVWDEGVTKRPYLDYQDGWIERFGEYLDRIAPDVGRREQEVMKEPEVVALGEKVARLNAEAAPAIAAVQAQLNEIQPKLLAMDFQFRDRKGMIDMLTNRIENAHDEDDKQELREGLAEYRAETFEIEFKDGTKKEYTAETLIPEFLDMKTRQGLLQAELGRLNTPVQNAQRERGDLVAKLLRGPSSATIASLRSELDDFEKGIKQIHVAEMRDLVDRCESCHLGIRSPITITAADMGGERVFTSHPNQALLDIHDPDRFGCSPCHGGNGVAVISVKAAHGHYKHWLWPMPRPENMEAGCVQCHTADLVLEHGDVVSAGKQRFRDRGCWGCHRYDGFEVESDQLTLVQKSLRDLAGEEEELRTHDQDVHDLIIALTAIMNSGDFASLAPSQRALATEIASRTNVMGRASRDALLTAMGAGKLSEDQATGIVEVAQAERTAIVQQLSAVDTSRSVAARNERQSLLEVKKIGPSLKEVRMKLRPEWLPTWIRNPADFRPTTKMPTYQRLLEDQKQVAAIAAFIWSRGVEGPLAKHEPGDAARGQKLVRDRGCLGCHSANISDAVIGNDFAAELTRVGEKAKYDYLVRWVSNPKQRTLPYSYGLKRDLTPDDFKQANVPVEFDHPNPAWPKEWGTVLGHHLVAMPNLRLSEADARDVATYLMAQKGEGATYPDPATVTSASPETIAYGEKLVKHYGCAGCHEIAGLEGEQKIGTELTKEGSKPLERLDFGHITKEAKHAGWYDHKGFFDRKLATPLVWDRGKEIPNEFIGLKMPDFRLTQPQITELTTFLLGSVETAIPRDFMNFPEDDRKAIQEGWWVVEKYNCAGCHALRPGDVPELWKTPWFQVEGSNSPVWTDANGEEHRGGPDRRPPTLVGEGARVDPQWLAEFLRNPALSRKNVYRNGLRTYLNVRMPTYDLSENEIGKLVRFFNALSKQPLPYVRPEQVPLTAQEAAAARTILKTECAKCHATADATTFSADVNAPGFFHAQARLRPAWMGRLIQTPTKLLPGTSMVPWFEQKDGHWMFKKSLPAGMTITGDHVDLMVRFLAQYNNPGIGKEE